MVEFETPNNIRTNLKYDITVSMGEDIYSDESTNAADIMRMGVSPSSKTFREALRYRIGRVILAAKNLTNPSTIMVVDSEIKYGSSSEHRTLYANKGEVQVKWTYIVQGRGIAVGMNHRVGSRSAWKLHEVLILGNDEHISGSSTQNEFDPHPAEVNRITISTE